MSEKAVSVKKNFLLNASYQVLTVIIPLVTVPYLSRVLGADGVGVAAYTQSIANYFVLFAMMGMSTYAVRSISIARSENRSISRVFSELYCCQLLFALPTLVCFIVFNLVVPNEYSVLEWCWGLWIVSAAFDVSWLYFGLEDFKIPTIRSFIVKIVQLICIFLFVKNSSDLVVYVLLCSGSLLLTQMLLWPLLSKKVRFEKVRLTTVVNHVKPCLVLFLPVLAISLYTLVDKIMLGQMSSINEVGYYEYAEKVCKMPLTVITAFGAVMLPRMAFLFSNQSAEAQNKVSSYIQKSIFFMGVAGCCMACVIAGSSWQIANTFFGPGFESCTSLLVILSGILPALSVANVLGTQCLLARGKDIQYTAAVSVGAVVNVALNLLLIPHFAAVGAAVATLLAEASVVTAELVMLRRHSYILSAIASCFPYGIIAVLVALCVYFIVAPFGSSWTLLFIALFGSIVCFLSGAFLCAKFTKDELLFDILPKGGLFKHR